MYPFKQTFPRPSEFHPGQNTCEFLIVHHTATQEGTTAWVLNGLNKRADYTSCHFLCSELWDLYKMGDPRDILWHAGESTWKDTLTGKIYRDLNRHSIGIEIIGPLKNGGFTDAQRAAVRDLIQHLMAAFNIPKERVLRHKDIAPGRKVDVADTFWNQQFDSWTAYQRSLTPFAR